MRLLYGYFLKLVIANTAAIIVDTVFGAFHKYGPIELILAVLLFAVQIYADFAGYTHMAVGAAKIMGFDLLENFNSPYMAVSVADFWRRWHMSLTNWFRDYVYIPLGGNRKGKVRKYMNILIVFLVSGLWHGASIHFVVWGGLNGLYQIIGNLLMPLRNRICSVCNIDRDRFSHKLLKGIVTFTLICISWIFFRANSLHEACNYINSMFQPWDPWVLFDGTLFKLGIDSKTFHMLEAAIIVMAIVDVFGYLKIRITDQLIRQGAWMRYAIILVLLFWTLFFGQYGSAFDSAAFIYTNF